jgi:phosphoribosylanthranilate isomerase
MKVKICGVTSPADARCAADAGAWAIGLNFHPPSPRYVAPGRAREIVAEVPSAVWRVGVFVDAERRTVEAAVSAGFLHALQFHGDEPPDFCRGWSLPVIKAVRAREATDVKRVMDYPVDFVLVDAYVEGRPGGTGVTVDWDVLEGVDRSRLILAGGLTPETVAAAAQRIRPFAVDVASGVESAPGVKDHEKVRQFIANAQTA